MDSVAEIIKGIGAAILCGGRASRLGGMIKGLIELPGGKTILERLVREIRAVDLHDILLCTNDAEPYAALGLDTVPDTHQGKGPLGGIDAALEWFTGRKTAVLFLPCDLPSITSREIKVLLTAYADSRSSIVYAQTADGIEHPLCAVITICEQALIRSVIKEDKLGVRRLWHELDAEAVVFDDPGRFVNVNTPEDLERYLLQNYGTD